MVTEKVINSNNDLSRDEGLEARIIGESSEKKASKSVLTACVVADVILFISVCACISGLWSDASLFAVTLIGIPVLFIRFLKLINKRVFWIVWLSLLAATVVTIAVMHSSWADGAKLLANELFDIGEIQQGYIYDRFEVSETAAAGSRLLCAGILSVFFAIGLVTVSKPFVRILTALGLFVLTVIICSYFGITPVYMAVISIPAALVLYFIVSSGASFKGFLIAAAVMGAVIGITGFITWAVAPEKNFAVSETEERLRDILAGRTVHFANMSSETDEDEKEKVDEEKQTDDPKLDSAEPPGITGGSINGVTLLFIIIAIAGILAVLFVPAVLLDKVKKRREKNREGMDSEDNAIAIRSHFMYLMRWFKYKGWCSENEFFENAIPDIEKEMSPEYAESFKLMHNMWQEAAFSEKDQTPEAREKMEGFVRESVDYLLDQADFKERMRIRYKYAL